MIEVDIETTGLQWYAESYEVFLVQFYPDDGEPVVLRHPEDAAEIQEWLRRDDDFRAWNTKFDFHGLMSAEGYELPPFERWHDGMVAAHLLDERKSVALAAVDERIFGPGSRDQEAAIKGWLNEENRRRRKASKETGERFVPANYKDVPDELMIPYALKDVEMTKRVGQVQYPALGDELRELYEMEMQVLAALFEAEQRGIPVDEAAAYRLELELAYTLEGMEEQARNLAGIDTFNPRSSKQLYEALKRRGADLRFVTGQSMDEENLRTVDDELAHLILSYRGEAKLLSTYVRPLLHESMRAGIVKAPYIGPDGRIHSNFRQVGARTGRMSSSDPNVQNFPRDDLRLRYLVRAEPGFKLVTADLESIELALFAAYAGDGRMKQCVVDPECDSHVTTADFVGLQDHVRTTGAIEPRRQRGKTFNYSMVYGAGSRSVRKAFRVSEREAKAMIGRYHNAYPEVRRLQRQIEVALRDRGYIKSAYGRRFRMEPRDAYKAVNYLIQGTAADMLKVSMVRLREQGVPIVAPVHDELLAHVPEAHAEEAAALIQEALIDHPRITEHVPLVAEAKVVDRWSQAKDPEFVPEYDQIEERSAA